MRFSVSEACSLCLHNILSFLPASFAFSRAWTRDRNHKSSLSTLYMGTGLREQCSILQTAIQKNPAQFLQHSPSSPLPPSILFLLLFIPPPSLSSYIHVTDCLIISQDTGTCGLLYQLIHLLLHLLDQHFWTEVEHKSDDIANG